MISLLNIVFSIVTILFCLLFFTKRYNQRKIKNPYYNNLFHNIELTYNKYFSEYFYRFIHLKWFPEVNTIYSAMNNEFTSQEITKEIMEAYLKFTKDKQKTSNKFITILLFLFSGLGVTNLSEVKDLAVQKIDFLNKNRLAILGIFISIIFLLIVLSEFLIFKEDRLRAHYAEMYKIELLEGYLLYLDDKSKEQVQGRNNVDEKKLFKSFEIWNELNKIVVKKDKIKEFPESLEIEGYDKLSLPNTFQVTYKENNTDIYFIVIRLKTINGSIKTFEPYLILNPELKNEFNIVGQLLKDQFEQNEKRIKNNKILAPLYKILDETRGFRRLFCFSFMVLILYGILLSLSMLIIFAGVVFTAIIFIILIIYSIREWLFD